MLLFSVSTKQLRFLVKDSVYFILSAYLLINNKIIIFVADCSPVSNHGEVQGALHSGEQK